MEEYQDESAISIRDLSIRKSDDGNICLTIKITKKLISAILNTETEETPIAKLKFNLTDRELEVLNKLSEGKNNNLIAEELKVTNHTVKAHLANIFQKLSVQSRIQAVTKAISENIIIK